MVVFLKEASRHLKAMYYQLIKYCCILGIGMLWFTGCQLEGSSSSSSSQKELQGDTIDHNKHAYDSLHALYLLDSLDSIYLPTFTLEELTGQIEFSEDTNFRAITRDYCYGGRKLYLRQEACDSLEAMFVAAKKDGIKLLVRSASRDYEQQRYFWNRDWKKTNKRGVEKCLDVMKIVAMPGISRHHWGTEVDIDGLGNRYHKATIENNKRYAWLKENALRFGYYQCYDDDTSRTGYQEETWHWSFYPTGQKMTEDMLHLMTYGDLPEFSGCEHAEEINVIQQYILGIGSVPNPVAEEIQDSTLTE